MRYRYIILSILLGLGLLYLFRSCSSKSFSKEEYSIGQDTRWHDIPLVGKERNLSTFNNELLTAIARQEHMHIHLFVTPDPMRDLEEKKITGILTTTEPNYSNENHLLFSEPYFLTGPVLIISSNIPMNGWNEKRRKIIAIQNHTPTLLELEKDPSIQLKVYNDILSALADLSNGAIDGAIFPAIPAYTYTETFYKNELKIATQPLTLEGIRLATLKNPKGESLIQKFNNGLKTLKQEGDYNKLLERWSFINVEKTP